MKKILALLCAAALFLCSAAMADPASVAFLNRFELRGNLPEGWHCSILSQNDLMLEANVLPDTEDASAPRLDIFISFNESYAQKNTLKDFDENEMELLRRTFDEYAVSFDMLETDSGLSLLVARETGDDQDFLVFYTIWQGYEIELTLTAGDAVPGLTLADDQIVKFTDYVRSLEIVPLRS